MLKNKEEHLPDTQQQKKPPYYWKRWPVMKQKTMFVTKVTRRVVHSQCFVISVNCDDRRCEGSSVGEFAWALFNSIFSPSLLLKLKIECETHERR